MGTVITFMTPYDPQYKKATGDDPTLGNTQPGGDNTNPSWKGTPADLDYINRWPSPSVREDVASGALPSGYYHYVMYGKDMGATYNFDLNKKPVVTTKTKSFLKKYGLILAVVAIAGALYWKFGKKGKKS